MTREMFTEILEELDAREPSRPFEVELTDGQRFEVEGTKALAFRPGYAVYFNNKNAPFTFNYKTTKQIAGRPAAQVA